MGTVPLAQEYNLYKEIDKSNRFINWLLLRIYNVKGRFRIRSVTSIESGGLIND